VAFGRRSDHRAPRNGQRLTFTGRVLGDVPAAGVVRQAGLPYQGGVSPTVGVLVRP
jgi:hypothetical protein